MINEYQDTIELPEAIDGNKKRKVYRLELYCENMGIRYHPDGYLPQTYRARQKGTCYILARRDGWRIKRGKDYAICPYCRKMIPVR